MVWVQITQSDWQKLCGKKVAPLDELRGYLVVRAVGGIRTRYLRLRHNCALSNELQPHAGRKLLEFVKFIVGSFKSVDMVIL